ncbi:ribonuclease HI family protein [Patescibacteria group bacterium]|nr:ribonuclease HI family protein [Patescibacteria group bacterium]
MGILRIFTDGGSRGNPGNAGIGIVVFKVFPETSFDETKRAEVIYEHSGFIGTATNNEAEYKALIKALEWLAENFSDTEAVEVYLDSKLVVEQINKNWKIKDSRMMGFANNAWKILEGIGTNVKFFHIRREKNSEADALVNQALDAHQS